MNLFLCIESGTNTCSVALGSDQGVIDLLENHDKDNNHAKNLTFFAETILKRQGVKAQDLSAVVVSKGPGSYTGLRIGVSAAKGICYGASIPMIAIGSLNSMAFGAIEWLENNAQPNQLELLCPMIDARRMEVYTQLFSTEGIPISEVEAKILDDSSFTDLLDEKKILFFGNGSSKAKEVIKHPNAIYTDGFKPSAKYMLKQANRLFLDKKFEDVAYFEPFYLKDFVATTPKNNILLQNK